jgi:CRISPR system Cascade subunit CasE
MMYLHKIILDKDHARRHKRQYEKDAYFLHQQIWGLVSRSGNQKRDFLYRVEYDQYKNVQSILLLAANKIESTKYMTVYVSPLYDPQIAEGESFRFKLRANPIVKRWENGKLKEFGLIVDAKHKLKTEGTYCVDDYSLDELIQEKGMKWLLNKGLQHGFTVKYWDVAIGNDWEYEVKAATEGKRPFLIRTLDFEGVLKMTDAGKFKLALFNGIGPAKAFGCGLLSLARA